MSQVLIDLRSATEPETHGGEFFGDIDKGRAPRKMRKALIVAGAAAGIVVLIAAAAGWFYWESMKQTPQYSLALLIDAARNNDQNTTDELVDVSAVVDDFMPQITSKAVDLYGRGLPNETIARIATVAAPLLPAVKDRARDELPNVIRERTEKFKNIPFAAMVFGAERYLDITVEGNTAYVKSRLADRPFQVKMKRNGRRWRIVALQDDQLSTQIAQKIGQEIVAVASKGGVDAAGERFGVKNLSDILRQAEEIYR
jgi:hypothetical protein